jgi:hypothetical protein
MMTFHAGTVIRVQLVIEWDRKKQTILAADSDPFWKNAFCRFAAERIIKCSQQTKTYNHYQGASHVPVLPRLSGLR